MQERNVENVSVKEEYIAPVVEMMLFDSEDIIVTSGGNGDRGNGRGCGGGGGRGNGDRGNGRGCGRS